MGDSRLSLGLIQHRRWDSGMSKEHKLQEFLEDKNINWDKEGKVMIHKSELGRALKYVKLLSLCSCVAIGSGGTLAAFSSTLPFPMQIASAVGSSMFGISTTFFLHWISKGYVCNLHLTNQSKIKVDTVSFLASTKTATLSPNDIKLPKTSFAPSSFSAHDKNYWLDLATFQDSDLRDILFDKEKEEEHEEGQDQKNQENP
eukprot:TRINITY_DN7649_c0_g1_i1.p1 TRINITY_DN7649_c0_g1~~TRINITY_DN7649_c0_g1_i1.p1  ORF type:complete len:228 (+),score=28.17 TRINITY_DN7649_c0_g1_i1:84-686(+)